MVMCKWHKNYQTQITQIHTIFLPNSNEVYKLQLETTLIIYEVLTMGLQGSDRSNLIVMSINWHTLENQNFT